MNVELDVEKRLQAVVAKDRVRIKEFFIDFDKLRKGQVGVAPVSIHISYFLKMQTTLLVDRVLGRKIQDQLTGKIRVLV